jgi:hypothetical protein
VAGSGAGAAARTDAAHRRANAGQRFGRPSERGEANLPSGIVFVADGPPATRSSAASAANRLEPLPQWGARLHVLTIGAVWALAVSVLPSPTPHNPLQN